MATDNVIIGANNTITIDSASYNVKAALNVHTGPTIIKDATSAGSLKHPGPVDDYLDLIIYITPAQYDTLHELTRPTTNRGFNWKSVVIVLKETAGATRRITGTAAVVTTDLSDSAPDQKTTCRIHVEFNHDGADVVTS